MVQYSSYKCYFKENLVCSDHKQTSCLYAANICCGISAQGCKFSDFSLISDFLTWTPLQIIFEIPSLEHISYDFLDSEKVFVLYLTFS